jgi:tRNA 2-thiocytidine biosynthesis protein TtcA
MTDAAPRKISKKTQIKIPKSLARNVGKALVDYQQIQAGDRILLGLSGGKDSLSLLHILLHFQRHAPISFSIGAVTIDPQSDGFDPSPLIPYMQELGIDYHFCPAPIVELADAHMDNNSYCSFCARMKRGLIYKTAREQNYNVIALAQHLDDLAESFLMSALYGGQLKTMKANYVIEKGDLRVIRPLVYSREKQMAQFAKSANLPVIMENCPACFAKPTQREHIKQLLLKEEQSHPHIYGSLLTAMRPLIAKGITK